MAYNEEANIRDAIRSILSQRLIESRIQELIVVASGCTDRTAEIVEEMAAKDPRVRLLVQERRLGKASAINLFIATAQARVLLMVSADVVVREGTLDALLRHFHDPAVGMVGGHPIPVNDDETFLGHAVHLQWRLHDRINREAAKLGEIVAFRNVIPAIPTDTAVDEISIQALVTQLGYRLVYERDAVVYNQGPRTVGDFLRQRRRIHAGHLRVRERQGYAAPTMSALRIARALPGSGAFASPRAVGWTLGVVALEPLARALGHWDYLRRRPHHVWEAVASTKGQLAATAASGESVIVFNIADFHHRELEMGRHASRQLARHVTDFVRRALAPGTVVSLGRSGTVIALVSADRGTAIRIGEDVVRKLGRDRLRISGRPEPVAVELAFAVIALPAAAESPASAIAETPTPSVIAG
jgi:biofilm PGA synthesis N-glycosyltransferase PgaC